MLGYYSDTIKKKEMGGRIEVDIHVFLQIMGLG